VDTPVLYRVDEQVAWVTLNRPERRNAFDSAMLHSMKRHIGQAATDDRVRALVIAAEGTSFCAGADLKGDGSRSPGLLAAEAVEALASVLTLISGLPIPVVSRVQGPVVGGGLSFVAAADVVVADNNASFTLREVRVGAVPAVVAAALLGRVSTSVLRELTLTGMTVEVQRAFEVGLVNRVVSDLDVGVAAVLTELVAGAPHAQAVTKTLLRELPTLDESERRQHAVNVSQQSFTGDEAAEGMAAFAEKRKPRWQS
jgi:enoyl-CoA hydratase/carnithine racemase